MFIREEIAEHEQGAAKGQDHTTIQYNLFIFCLVNVRMFSSCYDSQKANGYTNMVRTSENIFVLHACVK